MHERVITVRQVLPAAAIESSYWLSILTGTLLLGLGRGIDGRLRVAYRLASVMLVIGAVLAVTKGLHFGEALFLLVIAALLRTRKREFTQRAMSLTSATTVAWYLGLVAVVVAFFAAGVWAVLGDDSFDLWYFGVGEHSSRLARGLFAAVLGVVIYLIWQSFAVRRPALKLPDRRELESARTVYREHGGGEFAHLTFMGDKHLFWSADRHAVVAYGAVRDRLVALGSPSGPEPAIKRAILDFRQFADAQDRVPMFYEVLEPDLSLYHDLGFDLFKLGELATIRLDEFTLAGKRWEDLRQAVNRSVKERLTFEIVEPRFDTVLMTEVEHVSDLWLSDKHVQAKKASRSAASIRDYFAWSPLALVHRDDVLVAFANVLPPYGPTRHRERRSDAPDRRRAARHDGFSVRQGHAMGEGSRLRNLQPRHGAALGRRRQPVRAHQRAARRARIPVRRALLQLPGPTPLQGKVRAGVDGLLSGVSARIVGAGIC